MKSSIAAYCARIGADPLLVQGAGGNVSWKDGGTLWIKASGTWLADAAKEDIFVPVDLGHLGKAISVGDFSITPKVCGETQLRPSIETLLHALMPHRIVVHVHAVEVLVHLVKRNYELSITDRLDNSIRWASVEYHKPGAALAHAVDQVLKQTPDAQLIFLGNHGVVIGGADIDEIDLVLSSLTEQLITSPRLGNDRVQVSDEMLFEEEPRYLPAPDGEVHLLATDPELFGRLESDWALYPDHVVFMGSRAQRYDSVDEFNAVIAKGDSLPELVFIKGYGVFVRPGFSLAKQAQLRCYLDVLTRLSEGDVISPLSQYDIADLLNWDAERYRIRIEK